MPPANISFGKPDCSVCLGAGGWIDPVAQQSIVCPECHPGHYQSAGVRFSPLLARLQYSECRYFGPLFPVLPWLWVIHTGSTDGDIEKFFNVTGYVVRKRDAKKIKVSAHINYSARFGHTLTQGVLLDRVAWHVGGSRIHKAALIKAVEAVGATMPVDLADNSTIRKLNYCSWGTELQGPAGRRFSSADMDEVIALGRDLSAINSGLTVVTTHDRIDTAKRDPGKLFDLEALAAETGLVAYTGTA